MTFGADGRISSQGSISEIVKHGTLAAEIREEQIILDKTDQEIDAAVAPVIKPQAADGKLILAEEMQMGHVSASSGLSCSF